MVNSLTSILEKQIHPLSSVSPEQSARIMVLGKMYPPARGGIETHVRDLVESLSGTFRFDVVVANENRTHVHEKIDDASRLFRLARMATVLSTPICLSIYEMIRRSNAGLFHVHSPNPLFELALLQSKPRAPIVVTHHGDVVRQRLANPFYQRIYAQLLKRADTIIVSSHEYALHSPTLKPFLAKIAVIPMTVRADLCSSSCVSPDSNGKPYVLCVGRLVTYKGHEYLIRAMKYHSLHTILVGSGPEQHKLLALVKHLGFEKRFTLLTNVSERELQNLYHHCRVFALPSVSKNEAFGIVQLEAMMHSRPVIVTDIPGSGTSQVQIHGQTGFIIPPKNEKAIGDKVAWFEKNPELILHMGMQAKKRVSTVFSNHQLAHNLSRVYQRLLPNATTGQMKKMAPLS